MLFVTTESWKNVGNLGWPLRRFGKAWSCKSQLEGQIWEALESNRNYMKLDVS